MNKYDYESNTRYQLREIGFSDNEINLIFNTELLNRQLMQFYKQGGSIKKLEDENKVVLNGANSIPSLIKIGLVANKFATLGHELGHALNYPDQWKHITYFPSAKAYSSSRSIGEGYALLNEYMWIKLTNQKYRMVYDVENHDNYDTKRVDFIDLISSQDWLGSNINPTDEQRDRIAKKLADYNDRMFPSGMPGDNRQTYGQFSRYQWLVKNNQKILTDFEEVMGRKPTSWEFKSLTKFMLYDDNKNIINASNLDWDKDTLDKNGSIFIYGNDGNDYIIGSKYNDVIIGGSEQDTLNGGTGKDILGGNIGDDILNGGDGDDTLNGGAGNDYLEGGQGHDTYIVQDADTISDSDMRGEIMFQKLQLPSFFVKSKNDPNNKWESLTTKGSDTPFSAERKGNDLVVSHASDSVTIKDFFTRAAHTEDSSGTLWSGLGIQLLDKPAGTAQVYRSVEKFALKPVKLNNFQIRANPAENVMIQGNEGTDIVMPYTAKSLTVDAAGGDDVVYGLKSGGNMLLGGDGRDMLLGANYSVRNADAGIDMLVAMRIPI